MCASASPRARNAGRLWIAIPVAAVLAYAALLLVEYRGTRVLPGARWLSDSYDIEIYWLCAQFYPRGEMPYVDVFSEYPVISTLSFAIPLIVAPDLDPRSYRYAWGLLMVLPFVAMLLVIQRARREADLSAWPIAFMASPTLLYFSLNRFDILPALICALSLHLFHRERYVAAHVLLGVGVHVKWYPAVIFPVYLAYHMQSEGLFARRLRGLLRSQSLQYALVFVGTVLLLVLLCVLAFGWDGFMTPYRFHAVRGGQYFNTYWLTAGWLEQFGWMGPESKPILDLLFLAGQISIVWILLVKRIGSHHEVDRYAVLAIFLFVIFAKVDSPQWVLWYVPLVLMFASRIEILIPLLFLTLLNYLVFPIAFDDLGSILGRMDMHVSVATAFLWLVFVKDVALVAMVWAIFSSEKGERRQPAAEVG